MTRTRLTSLISIIIASLLVTVVIAAARTLAPGKASSPAPVTASTSLLDPLPPLKPSPYSAKECAGNEILCMSSMTKKPNDAITKAIASVPTGDGERSYQVTVQVTEIK